MSQDEPFCFLNELQKSLVLKSEVHILVAVFLGSDKWNVVVIYVVTKAVTKQQSIDSSEEYN